MTCAEFQTHAAELALGIAPAAVKRAGQRHLADDGGKGPCVQRLAHARRLVAQLGLALPPVRPSDAAWQRVEAVVGLAPPVRGQRARALVAWLLPALLCLVLVHQQQRMVALERQVSTTAAVARQHSLDERQMWGRLASGDARIVRVPEVAAGVEALAIVDAKARRAWLWASGLPPHQRWPVHWQQPRQSAMAGELEANDAGDAFLALTWPSTATTRSAGEAGVDLLEANGTPAAPPSPDAGFDLLRLAPTARPVPP